MLPKSNRIKTEKEFRQIFRNSRKFETEHFKIFVQNLDTPNIPQANLNKIKSMYDENGKFIGSNNSNIQPTQNISKVNQSGKLGVIISAKFGKAHDRNKCKRRIRNLLHHYVKKNSLNIVVQVKGNIKDLEFEKLKSEILSSIMK